MIDLHTHTTASDGQYTPAELVKKAYDKGIKVLAITDHDTIAGLEEGAKACKELQITFVPGIELNIQRPGCEFHLLGHGLINPSKSLYNIIQKLQDDRNNRNLTMIQHMNDDNIHVSIEDIQNMFPGQVLGRPHFAAWLESKGIVKHRQQAFDKYLARGRPWYVDRVGANLDESIEAIFESGGVPIVAHPLSLYLSWKKLEPVLQDFKERGIVGIEAYHPGARLVECKRLEEMARRLDLIVTAGSDFHGEKVRIDRKPGITSGDKQIEDRFWTEELEPTLKKYRKL